MASSVSMCLSNIFKINESKCEYIIFIFHIIIVITKILYTILLTTFFIKYYGGVLPWWGFVLVGFCPGGVLSWWGFPRGFCQRGFCSGEVLSWWGFVLVGFCPGGVFPSGFCQRGFCSGEVLSLGVLSWWCFVRESFVLVGFCPGGVLSAIPASQYANSQKSITLIFSFCFMISTFPDCNYEEVVLRSTFSLLCENSQLIGIVQILTNQALIFWSRFPIQL